MKVVQEQPDQTTLHTKIIECELHTKIEEHTMSEEEPEVSPSKRIAMLGGFVIVVIIVWVILHNVLA